MILVNVDSQSVSEIGLGGLAVKGKQAIVHVLLSMMPCPIVVVMLLSVKDGVVAMAIVLFNDSK